MVIPLLRSVPSPAFIPTAKSMHPLKGSKECILRVLRALPYIPLCGKVPTLQGQVDALSRENEELKKELAELQAQLKAQPHNTPGTHGTDATLDNKPWMKLQKKLCDEILRIRKRIRAINDGTAPTRSPAIFLESIDESIRHAMVDSGATAIEDEPTYDILRHELVPAQASVAEGTPLKETLDGGFGVCVGDLVLIRALVSLSHET